MKFKKLSCLAAMAVMTLLVGCSNTDKSTTEKKEATTEETKQDSKVTYPITVKHAFGETVIEKEPERVATISWGNQDVPLALGVEPVGVSRANYGVTGEQRLLPWTEAKAKELGIEKVNTFDDIDGLDLEAISDSNPDVILAAYSGITKEEYESLSEIAPVIAYPNAAWQTYWREQITYDATGMGKAPEGEALIKELEDLIAKKKADYTQLEGKTGVFCYFNPADLGKFYIYLPTDPRAAYLTDLGLAFPESVQKLAKDNTSFTVELSSENLDVLKDVDVIVAYGNDDLLKALQKDKLLGTVDAVKNGAVALIEDGSSLSASCTPSALSIPATIDEYLSVLGEAANKVK
ncbi:iron compound ABC uptake transporter substrate-binding protein PiaA [Lachnospiraceae bacterium KM106-2]|nr:iron compound ABC uptake transporter substrate-binding protein PiaA [Lachnospiraceae bacterium KM106-2]